MRNRVKQAEVKDGVKPRQTRAESDEKRTAPCSRAYKSEWARRAALPAWLHFYNHHRPHTAIGKVPPITRFNNLPGHYTFGKPPGWELAICHEWEYNYDMTSLTPPMFWILASLAGGRRHGYDIMRETAEESSGQVTLKATTLYATLDRLEREGLVLADGDEVVNGRARRYFRITDEGSVRLRGEVELIERSARAARARLAAGQAGSVTTRIAMVCAW